MALITGFLFDLPIFPRSQAPAWECVTTYSLYAFPSGSLGTRKKILGVLAPVGRMSLTIYVSQSLCGVPFFYGYGLGMYDKLSQLQALLIGMAFFSLQVMFAHWWLKRFHYGPLEWCWRAATYLTVNVPFVKREGSIVK